jgi:hypothetical protein
LQNAELEPDGHTTNLANPSALGPSVTRAEVGCGLWQERKSSGVPCLLSAFGTSQGLKEGTRETRMGEAPVGEGYASATVVLSVAVSLLESESGSFDATEAVLVIVPSLWGVTLIWTVAESPLARVPRAQVTVPAASEQPPCEELAESKLTPAGSGSFKETPPAVAGPLFVTVTVYRSGWPTNTGSGESVLETDRSGRRTRDAASSILVTV